MLILFAHELASARLDADRPGCLIQETDVLERTLPVLITAILCTMTLPAEAATPVSLPTSPVPDPIVTSKFGSRKHPVTGRKSFHDGIDLRARLNQKIQSIWDGKVIRAGRRGALGKSVEIYHPSRGASSIYGHLNSISVKKGQTVRKGEVIGKAGSSGRATAPHLHLAIKKDNKLVNPLSFIAKNHGKNSATTIASRPAAPSNAPKTPKSGTALAPAIARAQKRYEKDSHTASTFKFLFNEGAVSRNQWQEKERIARASLDELNHLEKLAGS